MKRHKQNRDIHAEITRRFIDSLATGCVPWIKPWDTGSDDGMPVNAATGRRYRGINVPILWGTAIDRGFSRDRWITFRQAQKHGGYVRRGEKGTSAILFRTVEISSDDENELSDAQPRTYKIARAFTLFNVEQCRSLPKAMMGEAVDVSPPQPTSEFSEADAMVKRCGARIRHGGNIATYIPAGDIIHMPAVTSFDAPAHYWCTLMHEMTHWTGHQSRLSRPGIVESHLFNSVSYAFEELIAEIGSAFLCAELNIKGDLRHEGYVASWIKLLEDRPRAIFQAAAAAQAAFDFLNEIGNEAKAA